MQSTAFPRFKLIYVFWAMSLVAAALATFGLSGIAVALLVFAVWFGMGLVATGRSSCIEVAVIGGILFVALQVLLFPLVRGGGREAALRTQCINNVKQIGLALLNYESANGHFPPPYIADESGRPMHSWRVLILPFMEHAELYERYNFAEPWDSTENLKLLDEMPTALGCPWHDDGLCYYVAATGKDTAWRAPDGVRMVEITRGTSKCLHVTETVKGIPWTKPEDFDPRAFVESAIEQGHTKHGGRITAGYADGHVETISVPQQAHWLEHLAKRSGEFDPDSLEPKYVEAKPISETSIPGWLLLVLCLLPAIPIRKWSLQRK